jgi:hypothetical protein
VTDKYYKTDITDMPQFQEMWDSTGTYSLSTPEAKFNIGDAILLEEVWDGYHTGRIIFASIEDKIFIGHADPNEPDYLLIIETICKQDEELKGEA